MQRSTYLSLLSQARRLSRRPDEAEDLLQTVLLAAVEAGRRDLSATQNRRWLYGALRNRAAFEARSALRRKAREAAVDLELQDGTTPDLPRAFITNLPLSLRTTALLALTGHTRPEIRHLLGLTDPALRQRLSQIRQRWNVQGGDALPDMLGLSGHLPFGLIRQALRAGMTRAEFHLGSHDPDGHLFVIAHAHKTARRGNI